MKITVTPDEFFDLAMMYILERFEERNLEFPEETSNKFIPLSPEAEKLIVDLSRKNVGVNFRQYRLKCPIINRNKYKFISKIFKGESISDSTITVERGKKWKIK